MARGSSAASLVDIEYEDIANERKDKTATCFVIDGEEVWLNHEDIEHDEKTQTVTLPLWLARKKGLRE